MKLVYFVAILGSIFLYSCDSNGLLDDYTEIEGVGWHQDSIVRFEINDFTDTLSGFNTRIKIRFNETYAYRNLNLFIDIEMPNGKTISDSVNVLLTDEKGRWEEYVTGFGSIKEADLAYRQRTRLPYAGNYKFKIQQGMRDEKVLQDILDVGLRVERIEQ